MEEFDIAGGAMVMTEELLIPPSCLPNLQKLSWATYVLDKNRPVESRPLLDDGCFPVLESLHAGVLKDDTLKILKSPYFLPHHLKTAAAVIRENNPDLVRQYIEIVAPDGIELKLETLLLSPRDIGIDFATISKVMTMQHLKRLKIIASSILLSDQHMAQLLSGLPLLEKLQLQGLSHESLTQQGRPALLTVQHLIEYCPLLERADILLDAGGVPTLPILL